MVFDKGRSPLYSGNFMYGYRSDEADIKTPDRPDFSIYKIKKSSYSMMDESKRPPVARTILPHIKAIPPKPDNSDFKSLIDGVAKRMAYKPPKYNRKIRRKFRRFVRKWIRANLTPILPSFKMDIEKWLEETNYPEWRKDEIRKVYESFKNENVHEFYKGYHKRAKIKIFTKEEFYEMYKHHRGIWAREDAFKAICGPFFKEVEKELFKLPYFIKKIPKWDRAEYISEFVRNDSMNYQCSDYTSFESQFTTDMMDDCEFELYRYMASQNPECAKLVSILFLVLAGDNLVTHKFFKMKVRAKRMSGEMNTSLGNGFSNLMFNLFAYKYYDISYNGPVVEGDDSLSAVSRQIPNDYFKQMGLNVKMQQVEDLSEASFCGIVFDPIEKINICDPRKSLCTTTWVSQKYAFANKNKIFQLIRCKALSLCFEYAGCPILSTYGLKIFNLLGDYEVLENPNHLTGYELEMYKLVYERYISEDLPNVDIGPRTRMLMEKMYNIPVSTQLLIEKDIDKMTLEDWDVSSATTIMSELWINNYDKYVMNWSSQDDNSIRHPPFCKHSKKDRYRLLKAPGHMINDHKMMTHEDLEKLLELNNIEFDDEWENQYLDYCDRYQDAEQRMLDNTLIGN